MNMSTVMRMTLVPMLAVLASSAALAHTGHDGHGSALLQGLLHPFGGLDHLMMALGLGLLMAKVQQHGKGLGLLGLLASLGVGFALAVSGVIANLSLMKAGAEVGIVASLLLLAVALWQQSRPAVLALLGVLGGFHGMAHGAEIPAALNPWAFAAGMLISMSVLYMAGTAIGQALRQQVWVKWSPRVVAVGVVAAACLG